MTIDDFVSCRFQCRKTSASRTQMITVCLLHNSSRRWWETQWWHLFLLFLHRLCLGGTQSVIATMTPEACQFSRLSTLDWRFIPKEEEEDDENEKQNFKSKWTLRSCAIKQLDNYAQTTERDSSEKPKVKNKSQVSIKLGLLSWIVAASGKPVNYNFWWIPLFDAIAVRECAIAQTCVPHETSAASII